MTALYKAYIGTDASLAEINPLVLTKEGDVIALLSCDLLDKQSDAVAFALYLRFLKRIASHLMNVATSIINPFHKIGVKHT